MTSSFTLVSPGYRESQAQLAFTVGAQLVAVLGEGDLLESWHATDALSPGELAELGEVAALSLLEVLDGGIPAADLTEAVTDAAVVFLLAMKRHGIADPKRIPACTVMWNLHADRARVHVAS